MFTPVYKPLAQRNRLAAKVMFAVLGMLHHSGGALPFKKIRLSIGQSMALDAWELAALSHGKSRWESALDFYSHEYVKAGLLRKDQGDWSLTDFGRQTYTQAAETIFRGVHVAYKSSRTRRINSGGKGGRHV